MQKKDVYGLSSMFLIFSFFIIPNSKAAKPDVQQDSRRKSSDDYSLLKTIRNENSC